MPSGLSVTVLDAISKGQLATDANPAVMLIRDVTGVPETVTTTDLVLHGDCAQSRAKGVSVLPARFTLRPGGAVRVLVHVPKARADYGILFSAHAAHVKGADTPVGAIGAQVLTGGAADCREPKAAAIVHHSAGIPPWALASIPVVLVFVILALYITKRRREARP
jgi:hypothetical protein